MTADLVITIATQASPESGAGQASLASSNLHLPFAARLSSSHLTARLANHAPLESFGTRWLRLLRNLDSVVPDNKEGISTHQFDLIAHTPATTSGNPLGTGSAKNSISDHVSSEADNTLQKSTTENSFDKESPLTYVVEIPSANELPSEHEIQNSMLFRRKESAQATSADKKKHPGDLQGSSVESSPTLPISIVPLNMPVSLPGAFQVRVDQDELSHSSQEVRLHEAHNPSVLRADIQPASHASLRDGLSNAKLGGTTSPLPPPATNSHGQSMESTTVTSMLEQHRLPGDLQEGILVAGPHAEIEVGSPVSIPSIKRHPQADMKQPLDPFNSVSSPSHLFVASASHGSGDPEHPIPFRDPPDLPAKEQMAASTRRGSSEGEPGTRHDFAGAHLVQASHLQATSHGISVVQSIPGSPGSSIDPRGAVPSTVHTDPQLTFKGLDSGDANNGASWIHGDARHAEAGFQDPALGWIGIKAETVSGSIHASLIASSTDAAQTLGGHLAGLNAYMADRYSSVHNITVAASDSTASWTANQEANSGAGQHPQPDYGHNEDRNQPTRSDLIRGAPSPVSSATSVADTRATSVALGVQFGNSAARVISVIA